MEPRAHAAEPTQNPDTGGASAWVADIARDLAALTEVGEGGLTVMRDLVDRVKRGEVADAVTAVDRVSRAIRRTIALKMRLRAEAMALLRGQHLPPARAATAPAKDEDGGAAPVRAPRAGPNLLGDLYDRAEHGDEIGDTPSVEVYRSVCKVLGVTPDETLFRRDGRAPQQRPAAASAAASGDVAVMERPRTPDRADRPGRDWPRRAGNGRDPPRSG